MPSRSIAPACCSLVLEGIPREVAAMITAEVSAPTIGIGAGPECDGQVLVIHDLVGMTFNHPAKFVRRYADVGSAISEAIAGFQVGRDGRQLSVGCGVVSFAEGHWRGAGRRC